MNLNRIFSSLVFLIYLTVAVKYKSAWLMFYPIPGMAMIWFPGLAKFFDQLGTGRGAPLDPDSPPCLFSIIGWTYLFFPALILLIAKIADM